MKAKNIKIKSYFNLDLDTNKSPTNPLKTIHNQT